MNRDVVFVYLECVAVGFLGILLVCYCWYGVVVFVIFVVY